MFVPAVAASELARDMIERSQPSTECGPYTMYQNGND